MVFPTSTKIKLDNLKRSKKDLKDLSDVYMYNIHIGNVGRLICNLQ